MKKSLYKIAATLTFTLVMFLGSDVIASPPGGGGPSQDGCIPPPCVPIDVGISALLVAGVAFGGKKIFDAMKN